MKALEVEWWSVELAAGPWQLAGLRELLSRDELDRAARFRADDTRGRWIVSRAALRRVLERSSGVPAGAIRFACGDRGRPRVASPAASPVHFNLSRGGALAAIVVGSTEALGVDIEEVKAGQDLVEVVTDNFSAFERQAIEALPVQGRPLSSLMCWTAKEAYLKAIGRGLSQPLTSFDVAVAPDRPARMIAIRGHGQSARDWSLQRLDPGPGHVGTVAVRTGAEHVLRLRRRTLTAADLLSPLDSPPLDTRDARAPPRHGEATGSTT